MRGKAAAARVLHLHGRDVERLAAFALHLVMVEHRAGTDDHFRDGVGEVDLVLEPEVSFHDCGPAVSPATISVRGCDTVGSSRTVET